MDLSFVIPAHNEEANIASTIQSIRAAVGRAGNQRAAAFAYEIVVVDNASTDGTAGVCRAEQVEPLRSSAGTVGAVRNAGAGASSGTLLIFLDADITLLPSWGDHFPEVFQLVTDAPTTISGSKVLPSDPDSFLSKVWFPREAKPLAYMNSAHLIVHRDLFVRLGGFDERLVSGEDSDFSQRACALGGVIVPAPRLVAIHAGSPQGLREFFVRERWHGHGDFQSWRILSKSRPAQLAVLSLASGVTSVALAIFAGAWALLIYPVVLLALSILAALHRTRFRLERRVPSLVLLYGLYVVARSLSLIDRIAGSKPGRWR